MIRIYDLSHWNVYPKGSNTPRPYEYDKIAANAEGIIYKCTDPEIQGTGHDDTHDVAFEGLCAAGLPVGEYHFHDPSTSVREQVDLFMRYSRRGFLDALDVEDQEGVSPMTFTVHVVNTLEEMAQRTGRKPWLYSNLNFLNNILLNPGAIAATIAGLWLAYPSGQNSTYLPKPAKFAKEAVGIWQKSWSVVLPGTPRQIADYNEWTWSEDQWFALAGGGPPVWDNLMESERWDLMKKLALSHKLAT